METTLNPEKTALVVIDLQKGITAMDTAPRPSSEVIANAAKLTAAFRKHHLPVFLVRVTPSADGKDALSPTVDGEPMTLPRDKDWATLVPEMQPQGNDFVITKHQWGAFTGTELDLQLRRRGIDTIVLCGIASSIGVESTARFAYELGYDQVFVEDASADRLVESHQHAFEVVFPRIGRVRSTEDVLHALG